MNCKTCKWWLASGECDRVNSLPYLPARQRFEIEAQADDDSGLTVRLLTGPEFGCVLHETRKA